MMFLDTIVLGYTANTKKSDDDYSLSMSYEEDDPFESKIFNNSMIETSYFRVPSYATLDRISNMKKEVERPELEADEDMKRVFTLHSDIDTF